MTPVRLPSQSAALAGVPAGVQAVGPWTGRRQLFVRFAGEAETATIYTSAALQGELGRLAARSTYHSISVSGRDPLAEAEFLCAVLDGPMPLPVMLAHDGQRPDALEGLLGSLALMQIVVDGSEGDAALERVGQSLRLAASRDVPHALVILPAGEASDPRLLRIVEQARVASGAVSIVLHPSVESASDRDRRWPAWLERAAAVHGDVRLLPQLPGPAGMR